MKFKTQFNFLEKINEWGFSTNPLSVITRGIEQIEKQHKKIDSIRSSLNYDIDGLVFKVNDLNLQKRLEILLIHLGGPLLINFLQKKLLLKLKIFLFK